MIKTDLRNLELCETETLLLELGEKKYRARQVYEWINKRNAEAFVEMTNISKELTAKLDEKAYISELSILRKIVSEDNFTTKYLFGTEKHNIIYNNVQEGQNYPVQVFFESVLLRYNHGNTVCVSSQAGCRMGCTFCASGKNGLVRNLTAGEMAAQVYKISKDMGERISNIVVMGMGEPFDNFENTLKFKRIINSVEGLNIGQRHITISTCGLVDRILELCEKDLQVTLAVSLHAPNDDIRRRLMPIAKKYPLDELLSACKKYADRTKRRITFEYALIVGVNDSEKNAVELAARLRNMLCHVNLIPLNEAAFGSGQEFKASGKETIERFARTLNDNNIETTVRRRLGNDINAACGQLCV